MSTQASKLPRYLTAKAITIWRTWTPACIGSHAIDLVFQVQFRAEFFNSFVHANSGGPGVNVDNPGSGTVRSGGAGGEEQLALNIF
jgi:hypothetical protein